MTETVHPFGKLQRAAQAEKRYRVEWLEYHSRVAAPKRERVDADGILP